MKRFQSIIQKYITNHERHKKYLAGVLALSVLVSFGVSAGLIMPAISMTEDDVLNDTYLYDDSIQVLSANNTDTTLPNYANADGNIVDNVTYSPNNASVKDLLIGSATDNSLDWANGANTAEAIAQKAKNEYFLGIAYDFCLFTKNDAYLTAADTEGRAAIGGNFTFDQHGDGIVSNDYNYQIGAGNFGYSTALKDTDDYLSIHGFAHAIIGGLMKNVNPFSSSDTKNGALYRPGLVNKDGTQYFPADEDLYKRFVLGNLNDSSHIAWLESNNWQAGSLSYGNSSDNHDGVSPIDELSQIYQNPTDNMIDFDDTFDYLNKQSQALSKIKGIDADYDENSGTVIFDAQGADTDTIYFNLPDTYPLKNVSIEFRNIPMTEVDMVVRDTSSTELKTEKKKIPACNLVVNAGHTSFQIGTDGNGTTDTIIKGYNIDNPNQIWEETISNDKDIGTKSNNHPASSKILYNFYNAHSSDVDSLTAEIGKTFENTINGNFNGVILAPDANLKSDDDCTGHLSGAIIVKNLYGGIEIGYRPYRGKNKDILPSSSGYGVPIKKIIAGTDTPLPNATFGVFKDGNETPESTFTSDEEGNGYVNIPSQVDFSGDTVYTTGNNNYSASYTIKEIDAPSGFVKDDSQTYNITVTETVGIADGDIIPIDGKSIPTKVTTVITQGGESFTIELHDIYSYENGTYKRIRRELNIDNETFYIDLNENGEVIRVSCFTGESQGEIIQYIDTGRTETKTITETVKKEQPVYEKNDDGSDKCDTDGNPIQKTEEVEIKPWENAQAYTISQIAWSTGTETYPKIDKITFYYNNGTQEEISNPSVVFNEWWSQVNIGSNKENVVGIKFDISGEGTGNLCVQTPNGSSNKNIDDFCNSTASETFECGETRTESYKETVPVTEIVEVEETKEISVPVIEENVLYYYESIITESELKTTQIITIGEGENTKTYKYDPETVMMMPQPSTTKTFTNERGLVFKKVGKSGGTEEALKGAKIAVKSVTLNGDSLVIGDAVTGMDNILDGSSETTVDVNKLAENQLYCFEETQAPDGYETANQIYFKKSGNTIYYTTDVDKAKSDNTEGWESVNLTDNGTDTQACITMTDIKISGAKIKLGKWKADYSERLGGAKFQLCDSNGNAIYPLPATVKDEQNNDVSNTFEIPENIDFDLYETLKNATDGTYNPEYIKNGYLKPGIYVLKEVNAPTGYDAQDFKFRVKDDNSIEAIDSGTPVYEPLDIDWNGNEGKQVFIKDPNGKKLDGNGEFKDIVSFTVKINTSKVQIYTDKENYNDESGIIIKEFDTPITFKKFEIQSNLSGSNNWNKTDFDIDEIIITTSDGKTYKYDGNSSGNIITKTDYPLLIQEEGGSWGLVLGCSSWDGINISSANSNTYTFENSDGTAVEKIGVMKFNVGSGKKDAIINLKIDKMVFYYSNGSSVEHTDVPIKPAYIDPKDPDTVWTKEIDLSNIDKQNVTKIEMNVSTNPDVSTSESPSNPTTPSTPTDPTGELLNLTIGNNGEIKIPNKKAGADMKVNIEKIWAGDTGFESLRPQISFTLKRRSPDASGNYVEDRDFSMAITLDGTVDDIEKEAWKASWSNLDRLVEGTDNTYKYYVVENITGNEYETSYSDNNKNGIDATGTITITNTLKTTDIDVTKTWVESDGKTPATNVTSSVNVKLQWKDKDAADTAWADVPGKTLTLTSPGYTGKFENLPAGKDYQVVERNAPTGWELKVITGNKTDGFIITNQRDSGSLTVEKHWEDGDDTTKRPNEIQIAIYRTTNLNSNSGSDSNNSEIAYGAKHFSPNDTDNLVPDYSDEYYTTNGVNQYNDYARLLQYSLYFYDANMCGSDAGTASAYTWRENCHEYSTIDGGFHDAGDHVMFGLPQGFTASTLGWSYYEFKDSYDKLGLTEHYQKIMKYFCDFFVNSTTLNGDSVSSFLYQKGDGGTDHSYWGSPDAQQKSQWGEEHSTTNGASNIAAQYAAALAQYAMNFPNDNSNDYLKYAKALYSFSTKYNSCASPGEYSDSECDSEQAWAAAWLYLATKDDSYKTACRNKLTSISDKRGYFWGDVMLGADVVYATHIDTNDNAVKSYVTNYLDSKINVSDNTYVSLDDWGSARHNTLLQMVALAYDKNTYKDWCQNQMNQILGKNSKDVCLVVGYADNSATSPHHRAASNLTGWDGGYNDYSNMDKPYSQIKGSHVLVGALCGGPKGSDFSTYQDKISDTTSNEVACDYNAGLVAAAAGLYDAYGTGKTYANIDAASPALLNLPDVNTLDAEPQSDDMTVEETEEDVLDGMTLDNPTVDVETSESLVAHEYSFNGELIKADLGLKHVKKIAIEFNSSTNANGMLKINDGAILLLGNVDSSQGTNNKWDTNNTNRFEYSAVDIDVSKFEFSIWYSSNGNNGNVIFYTEPEGFKITSNKNNVTVTENGTPITITANQSATWSISDCSNAVVFDGNCENTDKVNIKANSYYNGDVTITATASDGTTDTVTVTITGADIQILEGTDDVGRDIKLHRNTTRTVTVSPAGGNVTVDVENESIVTVTPESAQPNAINAAISLPTGRCNITAGSTIGNTDITFTRNGVYKTIKAEVVGDLKINGSAKMNKNSTQTLTVDNAVGNIWWEITSWSSGGATETTGDFGGCVIEATNGELKTGDINGTLTVKATDSDGTTAEFTITIQQTAVDPDIPDIDTLKPYKTITIGTDSKRQNEDDYYYISNVNSNTWEAVVENLDKVDANGNTYKYYIKEDTHSADGTIDGNGAKYYPVRYEGNGSDITGDNTILSVTNEKSETETPDYTLPSAGGKGADWYYIIGAGLMSGAVVMFVRRKRRSA